MAETYSVVLAGSVRETQTLDAVKPRLATLFRVDPARVEVLFMKGPTVLRKGLDGPAARQWVAAIEQTGALCWAEPDEEAAFHIDHHPLVSQQSTASGPIQSAAAPGKPPVTGDPLTSSPLVQELAESDGQEHQVDSQPAWADNQESRVEEPSDTSRPPADGVIQPTAAAVFDTPPPLPESKRTHIPRFVKCPKCGHVAESLDDLLITQAECPECGLLADKFAKVYLTQPLRGTSTTRPDTPLRWPATAGTPAESGNPEDSGRHWLAFWTKPDWLGFFAGSLFLSLVSASVPPVLYVAEVWAVESHRLSALNLAATGVLAWAIVLIACIVCFYCYCLWSRDRRVFLVHVVASLGVCAVLAVIGGALSKLFAGVFRLTDRLRLEAALTPARTLASPVLLFLALILYLGFIRLPAERNLIQYLNGSEYATKVRDARTLAGPDFPAGPHDRAYEYYRYVYVETSRGASPNFDKLLRRLVPDHSPASFNHQHSPDATLMVMNAIGFRDDLAKQGMISDQTYARLSHLASLWGQTGYWKGAGDDPVRRFDAQCPITRGMLRSLEKKTSQRVTSRKL